MRSRFLTLFFSVALMARSQERLGIANSNYFPVTSIFLNPSSGVDSRAFIQLNLAGVNAFVKSNMGYFPQFSYWHPSSIAHPAVASGDRDRYLYATGSGDGPVFIMSKGRFSGGAFVRARGIVNAHRIPQQIVAYALGEDVDGPSAASFDVRNAGVASMSWLEYGAHFGMMVVARRSDMITAGINARYINGINIFYANLAEARGNYNSNYLQVDTLRGKIRYNAFALGSGKGVAADIGVTYKKLLGNADKYYAHSVRSNCRFIDYKYRVGLSLRDLGYVRFRGNTSVGDVAGSGYFPSGQQNKKIQPYLDRITNSVYAALPISAMMPASASAQIDYNFENGIYLNVTAVKGLLPNSVTGVNCADLLSVCPRFELKQVEIAAPLTFHRFLYPNVGLAMRFRSFVVGVDNVVPAVMASNTYGLGVYASLAVTIFHNPACRTSAPNVSSCPPKMRSGGQYHPPGFLRKLLRGRKTYSRKPGKLHPRPFSRAKPS